jgi:hypothetical protein
MKIIKKFLLETLEEINKRQRSVSAKQQVLNPRTFLETSYKNLHIDITAQQ